MFVQFLKGSVAMVSRQVEIVNETGLHLRPGKQFVSKAKEFECDITVKKGEKEANAKSMLKVMKIGISKGDMVDIICDGADEAAALDALAEFIATLTE